MRNAVSPASDQRAWVPSGLLERRVRPSPPSDAPTNENRLPALRLEVPLGACPAGDLVADPRADQAVDLRRQVTAVGARLGAAVADRVGEVDGRHPAHVVGGGLLDDLAD